MSACLTLTSVSRYVSTIKEVTVAVAMRDTRWNITISHALVMIFLCCEDSQNQKRSLFIFLCLDVDECTTELDDCQQMCTNNDGGFNCSCESGYLLNSDMKTCSMLHHSLCQSSSIIIIMQGLRWNQVLQSTLLQSLVLPPMVVN